MKNLLHQKFISIELTIFGETKEPPGLHHIHLKTVLLSLLIFITILFLIFLIILILVRFLQNVVDLSVTDINSKVSDDVLHEVGIDVHLWNWLLSGCCGFSCFFRLTLSSWIRFHGESKGLLECFFIVILAIVVVHAVISVVGSS